MNSPRRSRTSVRATSSKAGELFIRELDVNRMEPRLIDFVEPSGPAPVEARRLNPPRKVRKPRLRRCPPGRCHRSATRISTPHSI